MKTLRCIIIEDEKPAQDLIVNYIENTPKIKLIKTFDNAIDARVFLKENTVDLIFTDVELPSLNGMDFLKLLSPRPFIIVISAYSQYALEAYELDVIDYLQKPVSFDRFEKAIDKFTKYDTFFTKDVDIQSSTIYVKSCGKTVKIELNDILYVTGQRDYVKFYLIDKEVPIITHLTMNKTEEILPQISFTRVHRSFLVAWDKITSFDNINGLVELKNNVSIPVSAGHRENIKNRIKSIN